jgi:hypothetical protein
MGGRLFPRRPWQFFDRALDPLHGLLAARSQSGKTALARAGR